MNFTGSLALALLLVFSSYHIQAQFVPSKYEVGINVGTLVYQGDLSASALGYTRALQPAVQIWGSRSFDDYISLRASLLRGAIHADESTYTSPLWRSHRGFNFSSSVTEFSVMLQWDLLGKTYREGMRRLSPYFFAGAGFSVLNVKRNWSKFDLVYFGAKSSAAVGLGIDTLHKTPSIVPVIPLGAGLRYMVSNHIYVNLEGTYRLTTSDYIDGFKYAGNPNRNDHYYGLSLGASYRFGNNKSACPKVPL